MNKIDMSDKEISNMLINSIESGKFKPYEFSLRAKEESKINKAIENHYQYRYNDIQDTHLFRMDDKVKFALINHKSVKIKQDDITILPFDNIFIDNVLEKDDVYFLGLHIHFPKELKQLSKIMTDTDYYFVETTSFNKETGLFNTHTFVFSMKKGLLRDGKKDSTDKFIENFVLNLLLFFNEPRVVIRVHQHNNERRIRHGKVPIPSEIVTIMKYDLEEYITRVYDNYNSGRELTFAFWVRSHKRKLMNPRYKEKKIISVKAFLKGEGLIVPQVHKLE